MHVTIFITVLAAVLAAFYIRYRLRLARERDFARIPAGEVYRERMCSFVLRGYRAARDEMPLDSDRRPGPNAVALHAGEASRAAGYMPGKYFDIDVGIFASFGVDGWSDLVDEWTQVYIKLNAQNPDEWALRRAASHWSETGFTKPFWPERTWKTFPSVTPRRRHFAKQAQFLATALKPKGQLDLVEHKKPLPALDMTQPTNKIVDYVHRTAFTHTNATLSDDPLIDDESLAARYVSTIENLFNRGASELAAEARAFFTPNRLTDIIAEKAFILRQSAVYAIRERLDEDADASEVWTAEVTEEYARAGFPQLELSRRTICDVTAAYVYLCRTSQRPPKEWADAATEELRLARVARITRLGTQADHPDAKIPMNRTA